MSICCADIPHLPGLESIIFRAGLTGGQRIVRWPYVAENDSIQPWVSGGELVFVTGINHRRNERNLCQLVKEAIASNVAGLVILTGQEYIQQIPNSVLELANQYQLPILEQPYSLKMVFVTEVISNAIVQDNLLGKSVRLFLTKLINGFDQAPELIHLRAGDLGISDNHPFTTLALRINYLHPNTDTENYQLMQVNHELELHLGGILKRRGIEWPVLNYDKDLLVIWPLSENGTSELYKELEQILGLLQKRFPEHVIYIGVSERKTGLDKLSDATEQARQALQFAVKHHHQRIFFYEQLGIARLYAAIPNRGLLAEFCKQHLGELCFARDETTLEMKNTLNHYFNHFGHLQQTADTMGLHRNTLSYRLNKIELRLGYSLQDSFLRLNLQNALLIEQVLFHHHNIEEKADMPDLQHD
ncbi:PucR family transcriptional regulator [Marinomonas foliarum]|uniref:PucR family transcriptional regulator ligand-binding domain-containing protein n=1 Tax=Marinomonas foliarum TaxID=491950 RepID=A0ABX7IQF3_9GAMM|nr:PucR family transcriptional regulator [Marinomonas foliarum]QRV24556.1 PucR family transcriptional regulator ligand-binding domain-containing protein [Marinomonas foliarum]